jgi:glutathione peroxidase
MKKFIALNSLIVLILFSCQSKLNQNSMPLETTVEKKNPISIHALSLKSIDGTQINLAGFKGKKILIVNTASECGYTVQYKDLEELYQKHKDKLVIIGIPTNDFGGQEPGSNQEIVSFCQKNYGVSFPMAAKCSTKGSEIAAIFNFLCSKSENGVSDAAIDWNFNKFLIDENGYWIGYFPSSVSPTSDEIISKL